MKNKLPLLFCALLSLGFLSACHTVQSEIVLMPVLMGTKTMARADRTGTCVDLDRSVIPPSRLALANGEVAGGYENTFIRGADPFPCNTRRNYSHQGAVLFDFSELTRRHAVVVEATLEGTIRVPVFPEGIVIEMHVNQATLAWAPGNFTGRLNTPDPLAQIPLAPVARGDENSALSGVMRNGVTTDGLNVKVTRTVQNWVQNRTRVANNGFVFAPLPSHVYAEENQNLIAVYSNVRLRLKILEPAH
jgi:hypothetical protein